ncbi:nitroreductase [Sulfurimonas marina]|uniref:Nitroreductase n=1 Tax=Sulfurimonas marina TaxID=2590551 RepID=A0A7M1AW70_9BACT|nr:nitroreductase [Sulfurimonas marina]QOP41699.1 nitroreductase [Sulfurimonas marina]
MSVIEILKQRKSVRAFLNKDVEKEKIIQILESAKLSPSGVNMQPYNVCVVSGKKKTALENKMLEAFDNNRKEVMDYQYYPLEWREPYKSRRKDMGLLLYKTLGIKKEDKEKQLQQWRKNYKAFGAPVVLYFFIDSVLEKGSYLDYGIFLQSVMLVATELGLGSCPMASLAEFPLIVRDELGIDKDKTLLCGIALGYEDKDASVNSFKTERIPLEEFTTFYE